MKAWPARLQCILCVLGCRSCFCVHEHVHRPVGWVPLGRGALFLILTVFAFSDTLLTPKMLDR